LAHDPYDALPYTDHAYAESHPDRLAVVARLSGWQAPAVERARVLEVGCGRGGNLLPMAAGLPEGSLVGFDRSARQIDEASAIAREAGVDNVTFFAASLESATLQGGPFDFVLCHGVYSWIPVAVRRVLLDRIAGWLAPGGIAYVSFNTLPGWYERMAARDWLRFSTSARGLGLSVRDASGSLGWLHEQISRESAGYRSAIANVGKRLAETERAFLTHEFLADDHHPEAVATFLAEADAAGLTYLGDAIPQTTAIELLPDAVAERARRLGPDAAQTIVDFIRNTAFRRALLVRRADAEERRWRWPHRLDPSALGSLDVASRLRPPASADQAEAELFEGPDNRVQVQDPAVRRALRTLAEVHPRAAPFEDLARPHAPTHEARAALAVELFDLWLATGALDLHTFAPKLAPSPGDRPRACPVARWHAVHGGPITNRWHQEVNLAEPLLGFILARLDGVRTRSDLALEVLASDAFSVARDDAPRLVDSSVNALARAALLLA
jgi:SAM-dependent methyltransferase